jgi:hypothetical protein
MFTGTYWKQALERAAKSAAQGLLGMWALDGFNTLNADYRLAFGVASGAAVLSLLTSIVTAGIGQPNSPSAVATTPEPPAAGRPVS